LATEPLDITADGWEQEVTASSLPVLVDFWSVHCPPCVRLAPTISALAADFAGRLKVTKLDIGTAENEELIVNFGIRGIPCLIIFKGGAEIARQEGAKEKEALRKWIEKALT